MLPKLLELIILICNMLRESCCIGNFDNKYNVSVYIKSCFFYVQFQAFSLILHTSQFTKFKTQNY
jgi:hypothetical protein